MLMDKFSLILISTLILLILSSNLIQTKFFKEEESLFKRILLSN